MRSEEGCNDVPTLRFGGLAVKLPDLVWAVQSSLQPPVSPCLPIYWMIIYTAAPTTGSRSPSAYSYTNGLAPAQLPSASQPLNLFWAKLNPNAL